MNLSDLDSLPPTLTAEQVAEILNRGKNQVYESARNGELPVLRLGRSLRFPTARILEMLGVDPSGGSPPNDEEPPGEGGPSRGTARQDEAFDDAQTTTGGVDDWDGA